MFVYNSTSRLKDNTMSNRCYLEGYKAAISGKSMRDNPYKRNLRNWDKWYSGYMDSMRERK